MEFVGGKAWVLCCANASVHTQRTVQPQPQTICTPLERRVNERQQCVLPLGLLRVPGDEAGVPARSPLHRFLALLS